MKLYWFFDIFYETYNNYLVSRFSFNFYGVFFNLPDIQLEPWCDLCEQRPGTNRFLTLNEFQGHVNPHHQLVPIGKEEFPIPANKK